MGAYDNPALIQDRSGEIYGKSMAAFGQGIAAGLKTYSARVEARRKEALAEQKYRRQREDAINLAGVKAVDAWAKGLRDNIPKDASALAFKSVEDFITENSGAYLDAYKNRALAPTAEERNKYQEEIQLFNKQAGMQTQAVANLTSGLDEIKQLAENGEGVFFESKGQIGFKMLSTGLPISGFENLDIKTSRNEQGETILNLSANVLNNSQSLLEEYGLNPEDYKNGKFSFDINLNTFNPNSYVAKGFDVKEFERDGVDTGFLNEGGGVNKSAIIEMTNAQGRTMQYYNANAYIKSITPQIESQASSWTTGNADDTAQARATLMKMGYSKKQADAAIDQKDQSINAENSVADLYRDFVLSNVENTQVGRLDEAVINDIKKYNKTVSENQQIPIEELKIGDLYIYSGGDLAQTTTTTDKPTATEITIDEAAKTYSGYKAIDVDTPQDYINILLEQTNTDGAMPRTIDSAAREMALTKDKDGFPEYPLIYNAYVGEDEKGTDAQAAKNALLAMRDNYNENTIFILSASGAVKNVIDFNNKNQRDNYYLQKLGFKSEKVKRIQRKYLEQYAD